MGPKGNCVTPSDRDVFIREVVRVWHKFPKLRLGQLLDTVCRVPGAHCKGDLFNATDLSLLKDILEFEKKHEKV